jgi:hypothetical protein
MCAMPFRLTAPTARGQAELPPTAALAPIHAQEVHQQHDHGGHEHEQAGDHHYAPGIQVVVRITEQDAGVAAHVIVARQQVTAVREQEQGHDPEDERGAPQAAHAIPPSASPDSGSRSAVAWPPAGPAADSAAAPPSPADTPAPPGTGRAVAGFGERIGGRLPDSLGAQRRCPWRSSRHARPIFGTDPGAWSHPAWASSGASGGTAPNMTVLAGISSTQAERDPHGRHEHHGRSTIQCRWCCGDNVTSGFSLSVHPLQRGPRTSVTSVAGRNALDEGGQPVGVQQVGRADGQVVPHVVEGGPHLVQRDTGQRGPS